MATGPTTQLQVLQAILAELQVIAGLLRPPLPIVTLTVNGQSAVLTPNGVTHMAITTVNLGHTVNLKIEEDDANGNPMLVPVPPASPPVWTQTTPATGSFVVSGDGMSAVYTPIAIGTDTLSVTLSVGSGVGGATFRATAGVNVIAALQVLTSIKINAVVT
jgi:hypothetical protein